MKQTIKELYQFQLLYLTKITANIPEERLYEKQTEGYNSAGWLLGHIIVEAEDVFRYLKVTNFSLPDPRWEQWFKNATGNLVEEKGLPTKEMLLEELTKRYNFLMNEYMKMEDNELKEKHPSEFLTNIYTSVDAWFVHHLVTHIAIHCGNITTWKKIIGLEVQGF